MYRISKRTLINPAPHRPYQLARLRRAAVLVPLLLLLLGSCSSSSARATGSPVPPQPVLSKLAMPETTVDTSENAVPLFAPEQATAAEESETEAVTLEPTARARDRATPSQTSKPLTRTQDSPQQALAPEATTTITLDLSKVIGKIDARAFGGTMAPVGHNSPMSAFFWRSSAGQLKLRELGLNSIYYWIDRNDWRNPYDYYTAVPQPFPSKLDTPEFLSLNQQIGTEPVISVNITILCHQADLNLLPSSENVACERATPALSQDWLRLSNLQSTGTPKTKYVALGVEPYAGCRTWINKAGINCTTQREHKILLSAAQYVSTIKQWATALKSVDPTIKIGVHLQPNTFLCEGLCAEPWDKTVLQQTSSYIDFVMVHQYFLVNQPAPDETTALKYSYYQEQLDSRVADDEGVTAMPSQIRKELVQWLPAKKNIPIFVPEFNAARIDHADVPELEATRRSLYAGFSVGELFLDLLQPVNVNGTRLPGARRVYLHDLFSPHTMITQVKSSDSSDPDVLYLPAWHILAALRDFRNKSMLQPAVKGNPTTTIGRPALKVYAVKSRKQVWLAVFNHDPTNAITARLNLVGVQPTQASVVQIGQNASSFLTQNTFEQPATIAPTTSTVPSSQFTLSSIRGLTFAPHTLTVMKISGQ